MPAEVVMPKLGLTMEQGLITNWLVHEGDQVAQGQAILEIETDKATTEIEAPASGRLGPILYPVGATVEVGQIISFILAPGEDSPRVEPAPPPIPPVEEKSPPKEKTPAIAQRTSAGQPPISPVARRLAAELNVDLSDVVGTGPHGRVMEEDVRRAAADLQPAAAGATIRGAPTKGEVAPLEGIRRRTADRMVQSFTTAPHFYLSVEVDVAPLLEMCKTVTEREEWKEEEHHPTVSDLLIALLGRVLHEHGEVNARWEGDGVRRLDSVDVGLAVSTDRGLIVPVVRNVDHKSLVEISAERKALVEKARGGTLSLREIEGGSFTLSNLGTFAVDHFNAIVNPPQAAILAVGRMKDRPFAENGTVVVRPTMFLTLSVDHRILDGAEAARFLDSLVALMGEPSSIF